MLPALPFLAMDPTGFEPAFGVVEEHPALPLLTDPVCYSTV